MLKVGRRAFLPSFWRAVRAIFGAIGVGILGEGEEGLCRGDSWRRNWCGVRLRVAG